MKCIPFFHILNDCTQVAATRCVPTIKTEIGVPPYLSLAPENQAFAVSKTTMSPDSLVPRMHQILTHKAQFHCPCKSGNFQFVTCGQLSLLIRLHCST
jgi:hypothetical protein